MTSDGLYTRVNTFKGFTRKLAYPRDSTNHRLTQITIYYVYTRWRILETGAQGFHPSPSDGRPFCNYFKSFLLFFSSSSPLSKPFGVGRLYPKPLFDPISHIIYANISSPQGF